MKIIEPLAQRLRALNCCPTYPAVSSNGRRVDDPFGPNGDVFVHRVPCKNCPSARGTDLEAQDVLEWVANGTVAPSDAVFPCGWRPNKLCRGVYDKVARVKP